MTTDLPIGLRRLIYSFLDVEELINPYGNIYLFILIKLFRIKISLTPALFYKILEFIT